MSIFKNVADSVENHIPSGFKIASNYAVPQLDRGYQFRGRAILIGSGLVSLLESVTFLALTILTKVTVGMTSGQYKNLNRVSQAFGNNTMESGFYAASLLVRGIIHPNIVLGFNKKDLEIENFSEIETSITHAYHEDLKTALDKIIKCQSEEEESEDQELLDLIDKYIK